MGVPIALFLIALAVRILTGALFSGPAYPDSYYYVDVARQLAAGHGFSVDFIWNFVEVGGRLPDPSLATLPIPSNAHWMPLAALVQVPFIWLLGPTVLASSLPFWICSAAVAPLTWFIARDAGLPRYIAIGAALLVAVPGGVAIYLAQPDNFALFMLLGALSLWMAGRGFRGDRRAFVLGGVFVGLATLSRNDGILLGIPFALAVLADLVRRRPRIPRVGWGPAIGCAVAFLLVASPWYLRQLAVFGSISPSSPRILFINDYEQLYSVTGNPTLSSLLSEGIGPLLQSRFGGLVAAVGIFITMPLLGFLAPFTAIGAWLRRRDSAFQPWLIYAITLFAVNALLFAVHVPYGTFIHSAVALLPHAYLLSLLGIVGVVEWVARHRPSWNAARASRVFVTMGVAVTLCGAIVATLITLRQWNLERTERVVVAATLDKDAAAGDRVMTPDAGGFRYYASMPGIVTPDDPLPVVEQAMREYDIRWLVLERDHITPALAPILAGTERPSWLSAPVLVVPAPQPSEGAQTASTANDPGQALPMAAVYAVCLTPDDPRCAQ